MYLLRLFLCFCGAALSALSHAQTYTNTTTATITGANACTGGTLITRSVTVPNLGIVSDLNIGFVAQHTWRGDIQLDLTHSGVTRRLLVADTGNGGLQDNYSILMDDSAALLVNSGANDVNHSPTGPPYQWTVRPNNPLSGFNGQSAQGVWTLTMCDAFPGADNGTFLRADFIFTIAPPPQPSFTVNKTTQIYDPLALGLYAVPGNEMIYTISVTNTGPGVADNNSVFLADKLPPELTFYNGDIDGPGPEINPVQFTASNTPGVTLSFPADVGYSDLSAQPANFAQCSYVPTAGYDPNVTYICFNPKGSFAAGTPNPQITISFRARID